jgi:hypothetical protein
MKTKACIKVARCCHWPLDGACGAGLASQEPCTPLKAVSLSFTYLIFFNRIESLSSKLDALTRFSAPLLLTGQKGGDGIGYSGYKHQKGEKIIAITENQGYVLAPVPVAPVNETDMVLFPEGLKALKQVAKEVGLDLRGAYVNLDGGFDSAHNRKCIFNAGLKMFHMCWALSDGSSKLIPIDEQPNHQIVHLFRLGKAKGATHEPLNPGPEIDVLALDFLRVLLAHVVLLWVDMPLVGSPAVRVKLRDAKGLQELL